MGWSCLNGKVFDVGLIYVVIVWEWMVSELWNFVMFFIEILGKYWVIKLWKLRVVYGILRKYCKKLFILESCLV